MKKKIMMFVFLAILILSPVLSVRAKITNDSIYGMSVQRARCDCEKIQGF